MTALCVLLFALYTTYAWVRHAHYLTTGFDLGIFDQVTRDYAGFRAPIVTLKGPGYNLLGDHFHPLIALWAPLYWVWADPRMLLAAQAALVAGSVVPVVRFARRRSGAAASLTVGAVYGLSWPLQRMIQFDVHEIAFAVPLIAVVIDQLDLLHRTERRPRYLWLVLACLALLGVREDMGAFVVLVAVLVVARRPWPWQAGGRGRAAWGAALAVAGVAGYELATAVVIPHLSGGAGFVYWTFPALGPDPASAVRFALTQPWSVARLMVTPWVKAHTLLALGLPTLYLGLGSRYLLLAAPFLAQRMLNERELLWTTNFHYSSVLAPILVTAAVDTLGRVPWERLTRHRLSRAWLVKGWLAWCVGVVAFNVVTVSGDYAVSKMATARFWARDARVQSIAEALPRIPDGVCVEADNTIAPQLTGRDEVYRIGRSDERASWLVLDVTRDDTGWQGTSPAVAYEQALDRGFVVVWAREAVVLMTRPGPPCR